MHPCFEETRVKASLYMADLLGISSHTHDSSGRGPAEASCRLRSATKLHDENHAIAAAHRECGQGAVRRPAQETPRRCGPRGGDSVVGVLGGALAKLCGLKDLALSSTQVQEAETALMMEGHGVSQNLQISSFRLGA